MVRNKVIPAGSVAHIIQRAPGNEPLFLEEGDYLYFLRLLKESSSKHHMDVFCFALMPNHFHLLVRFLKDNASSAIKNICEKYAWFFNSKYKRKGHVFYGAFRASLCLDDSYLLTSSLYIHANPVKAKLASQPSRYRWSSCSLYTEHCDKKTFIKYRFILETLSNNIGKARRDYNYLLLRSLDLPVDNILKNPKALMGLRQSLIGDFLKINKTVVGNKDILDDSTLENRLREFSESKKLRNPQARKARLYLIQQLLNRGFPIDEIARELNLAKRTIYEIVQSKEK